MKRILLLILFAVGCATTSMPTNYVIECAAPAGAKSSCDLVTFIHACQKASGRNFTWTKETDAKLHAESCDCPSHAEVPAAEFDTWFAATLARHGFESHPVGPPHLAVHQIDVRR